MKTWAFEDDTATAESKRWRQLDMVVGTALDMAVHVMNVVYLTDSWPVMETTEVFFNSNDWLSCVMQINSSVMPVNISC